MGMSVPERRVIVVGGGAAGMMASIFAGKAGARVTLLERGEKLGKKVYITGKGRCNVTNDCTLDEFLHEVARNPRFLYSALSFFSPRCRLSKCVATPPPAAPASLSTRFVTPLNAVTSMGITSIVR